MKTKVYIAGPMSGLPEFNRPAFHKMDVKLSNAGYAALNPALLPDGLSQPEYMDICCAMLRCCDAILMLDGWDKSQGAVAEYHLAKKLGKQIIPMANFNQFVVLNNPELFSKAIDETRELIFGKEV
ncbi:DUF4406 domain-containing protein [Vibrio aestuarianus]|uniref:DUF4406 domain-containing protein n=1 Tax=Vibrio aestuarianus TaxID=28171 RepID=UPI001593D5F6